MCVTLLKINITWKRITCESCLFVINVHGNLLGDVLFDVRSLILQGMSLSGMVCSVLANSFDKWLHIQSARMLRYTVCPWNLYSVKYGKFCLGDSSGAGWTRHSTTSPDEPTVCTANFSFCCEQRSGAFNVKKWQNSVTHPWAVLLHWINYSIRLLSTDIYPPPRFII
jgi:hypothetical protein